MARQHDDKIHHEKAREGIEEVQRVGAAAKEEKATNFGKLWSVIHSQTKAVNCFASLRSALCGRPFSMFDEPAMRTITNLALAGAKETGVVGREKVRAEVIDRASKEREIIKAELKQKLLSISADMATCNSLSFIGILVQYQVNGEINVKNLECRMVHESPTAENIKIWFQGALRRYGIDPRQIICVSTDAAANMKKAAFEFIKDLNLEGNFIVDMKLEDDDDENIETEDQKILERHYPSGVPISIDPSDPTDFDENEDDDDDDYEEEVEPAAAAAELKIPNAYQISCVVHQFQLAIMKFLKSVGNRNLLKTTRTLAAKLRTSKMRNELRKAGLKNAIIDQATRWSSTSRMNDSVLYLKEFCVEREGFIKGEFCITLRL